MKRVCMLLLLGLIIGSCSVQQFAVNTTVKPFQNGGVVFGESVKGLKRNKDYTTGAAMYVLGINILRDDPAEMADFIKAEKYTIETRRYFVGDWLRVLTGGIISASKITVLKREE
jgi:hypothetical protein